MSEARRDCFKTQGTRGLMEALRPFLAKAAPQAANLEQGLVWEMPCFVNTGITRSI